MTHTYTYTRTDLCERCEHPIDWHRHDDGAVPYVNGHNSHGGVNADEPPCPCRCIGYDCIVVGPPPRGEGRPCDCPAYVGADHGEGNTDG